MSFSIKNDFREDYSDLLRLHNTESAEPQTSKFMSLSLLIHGLIAISAAFLSVPLPEPIEETITVEIEVSEPLPIPKGILTPETRGASPAPVVAEAKSKPVVETTSPKAAPKVTATRTAPASFKDIPASLDDIEAPELEGFASAAAVATPSNSDFSDIESAVSNLQSNSKLDLDSVAQELESDVQAFAGESDIAVNEGKQRNNSQATLAAIAAARAQQRAQESNAISAAMAAENAAAQRRAAQAKAREEALAQQRAAALARGNGGGNGTGAGATSGKGVGNTGENTSGQGLAGAPNGTVRSLEQLRQMPGNPIPKYSLEERKREQQGLVTYHAYVSKEGRLVKFRQISSTGHVNLDQKTFDALRKWKFYPGQEGWVELPFKWDLKGGPVAIGGTLRTARR